MPGRRDAKLKPRKVVPDARRSSCAAEGARRYQELPGVALRLGGARSNPGVLGWRWLQEGGRWLGGQQDRRTREKWI